MVVVGGLVRLKRRREHSHVCIVEKSIEKGTIPMRREREKMTLMSHKDTQQQCKMARRRRGQSLKFPDSYICVCVCVWEVLGELLGNIRL